MAIRGLEPLDGKLLDGLYIQNRYRPGFRRRVRWRGGNQRYDARLRCSGLKVERLRVPTVQHLEITSAVHPNDYLMREHLHREGFSLAPHGTRRDPVSRLTVSTPTVRSGGDIESELANRVNERILAKSAKRYPPIT